MPAIPFLAAFLTKKEYYRKKDLGSNAISLSDFIHFYTIVYTFITFKLPSLSTKERKANFNINDLIFRKKFNLPSGALLSAEHSFTKYNSAESRTNKYKLFGTKSKQIFQIYRGNLFF